MPNIVINHPIGQPFIELAEVDSTNNYAMGQIKKGMATPGTAYFATMQTAGKGQRGNKWLTQPGENLILSVVFNTNRLSVSRQFPMNVIVALAAYDLFYSYAGDETKIKWPNDIYWRDRKAAGILIENIIRGQEWQWAVAGVGMNVNQTSFDDSLINPVSLKQICGRGFDVVALAKELCGFIETRFAQLQNMGFGFLLSQYNTFLYKRNETVKLKKGNALFSCVIKEANENGQLVITGASKEYFEFGEVEWVR